ncbi:MAG: DNA mismatch repair endonuclease MutL [Bacteroidia bacterium]|nr:DNA mismatch repair endonuclease MutL [Bacteroidia bacterium]
MQHLIQLLPDAIANQIAAGEVVQRPASVVKELMENAIDAGATRVEVSIREAGKALIQVTDNGSGMSAQDARMAFERHATSKIRSAEDLNRILTFGFRGEALASIAAVAQVKLRTRLPGEELGTELDIEASEIKRIQAAALPPGTTFQVRNLFYNVPARRNFLKSNPSETRQVLNEFVHIAVPRPEVHCSLTHNDTLVYDLPAASVQERLLAIFGAELRDKLLRFDEAAGYVRIWGFAGSPDVYRKQRGEQLFFVNSRYFRSAYLHHAIAGVYQEMIPKETHPFYCIFFEISPEHVDVNVHPTKSEVKFDDENTLYALLQSAVKRALAEWHQSPELGMADSELRRAIYDSRPAEEPEEDATIGSMSVRLPERKAAAPPDWQSLFGAPAAGGGLSRPAQRQMTLPGADPARERKDAIAEDAFLVQFQQRYIVTSRNDRLLIIDQRPAHQRILYERFLRAREGAPLPSQQVLFPQTLELSAADFLALQEVEEILQRMGFEVKEFARNTMIVYGVPAGVAAGKIREIFDQILEDVRVAGAAGSRSRLAEGIARAVARRTAISSNHKLSPAEMRNIANELFRCENPGISPSGKPTYRELSSVELEEYFR